MQTCKEIFCGLCFCMWVCVCVCWREGGGKEGGWCIMQSKPCERKRLRLCKEKQDPTVVVVVCCGFDAPELCVCVLKCVWYFFPGCLLAAAWSCANNSLSLNIFILLSASSHALWASDWWVHIEGYRRPYQFCSDVSSSMARQYFFGTAKNVYYD